MSEPIKSQKKREEQPVVARKMIATEPGAEGEKKTRNKKIRYGYRRPTSSEYSKIRLVSLAKTEKLLEFLRDIDAKIDDASTQFDRYQKRCHGALAISFREVNNLIYPIVLSFYFTKDSNKFRVLTLTDREIEKWSVQTMWSKEHKNPGMPFRGALYGVQGLIEVRREVMAGLTGRSSHIGLQSLEQKVSGVLRKMDERLDALVAAMGHDWNKEGGGK